MPTARSLGAEETGGVVLGDLLDLHLREAELQHLLDEDLEALSQVRVNRLAQVGGDDRAGGADFLDVAQRLLPGALVGERRREAALEVDAVLLQVLLPVNV